MSSEYNNVISLPNNIVTMPYNVQYIPLAPQYQYLPKSELNTYIVNPPVYLEQKNFSDFIDCEISMEENADISSNINSSYGSYSSRSKSPVLRMKNNPINAINDNNMRPRSPNIVRNNNFEMNNYNNSYEIVQYSQNNSPMNRSNSSSNFSIQSPSYNNSPVINNNPIMNNITPVISVQNQYSQDNMNYNNRSYSNYKQRLYNSPIKKSKKNKREKYSFPKTLSKSTIYKDNNNFLVNDTEMNVNNFQYNPPLFNLVPVQNYQSFEENPFLTNINANNLNNNNYQGNNIPFKTSVQAIPQTFQTQFPNNKQNTNLNFNTKENVPNPNENNLNNNILNKTQGLNNNKNPFSSVETRNNQISLINTNSKNIPNVGNLFKSCSNTHYSSGLLSNSNSINSNNNSRRSSSPNNLNVSGFNINKEINTLYHSFEHL